jgi:hypothetical protein
VVVLLGGVSAPSICANKRQMADFAEIKIALVGYVVCEIGEANQRK